MAYEGGDDDTPYLAYCCGGCIACCACTTLCGFGAANLAYMYYMANPMKLVALIFGHV